MPPGPRRRIDPAEGAAALRRAADSLTAGAEPQRADVRTAVRHLLEALAEQHPGRSVEVRVPPHGVVQCVAGPRHTRGTPANVVECDGSIWIQLAVGLLPWSQAQAEGLVRASGERSDLGPLLPLAGFDEASEPVEP